MNETSTLTQVLDTLTSIGYQFGPFFFSILFTLVITNTARKWYAAVPSNCTEDKKVFKTYFHASWTFGMLLVATSVLWWVRAQWEGHHLFAANIVSLRSTQQLRSLSDDENFWERVRTHQPVDNMQDYWFVAVTDHPIRRGDTFLLNYWDNTHPDSPGAIGESPPPNAVIHVRVSDPLKFPQRYTLVKTSAGVDAVPVD
jgi:hypothetical protein